MHDPYFDGNAEGFSSPHQSIRKTAFELAGDIDVLSSDCRGQNVTEIAHADRSFLTPALPDIPVLRSIPPAEEVGHFRKGG
jgi:hypothetical protein